MALRNIIKDKYLRAVFILSFLISVVSTSLALYFISNIKNPLIIHFDTYKGIIDFIGWRSHVFGIIISGFLMGVINLLLSNHLYFRERFLSYIFAFFTLLLSILILITISVIISVN